MKIGQTFRNHQDKKCYVVNIFDIGGVRVVTWKFWHRVKQRWYFETDYEYLMKYKFKDLYTPTQP